MTTSSRPNRSRHRSRSASRSACCGHVDAELSPRRHPLRRRGSRSPRRGRRRGRWPRCERLAPARASAVARPMPLPAPVSDRDGSVQLQGHGHAIATALVRTNSSRPSRPPSRPKPGDPDATEGQLAAGHRRCAVDVDAAGLELGHQAADPGDVVGPEVRGEPVVGAVGDLHRFLLGLEAHERQHRAEHLDLAELAGRVDVTEAPSARRRSPSARRPVGDASTDQELGAAVGPGPFDHGDDPFLGGAAHDRAHAGRRIEGITQRDVPGEGDDLLRPARRRRCRARRGASRARSPDRRGSGGPTRWR